MDDWEYTFGPVSKEEWIRQIETDLRQKPVSSLNSEWWPGEPLIPLVHRDDLNGELIRLPDHLFKHPPRIIEWVKSSSLSETHQINKDIHNALQFGAQIIVLEGDIPDEISYPQWMKEVYSQIIKVHFQPFNITVNDLVRMQQIAPDAIVRIVRNSISHPLTTILDGIKSVENATLKSIRFVYPFTSSGDWTNETAATFNHLLSDLNEWKASGFDETLFFENCILSFKADADYFKQIIQIRTIHLIWQNLKKEFSSGLPRADEMYMECHIVQENHEKPDSYLIRASMTALAAALAGTHALCIHASTQDETPEFYKRINRNILHLLDLESGMYKGCDPLAGAYAIDFHTFRWVSKIWDQLREVK